MSEPDNPNQIQPRQYEQMITAKISGREAHLLKMLRRYSYCEILVTKTNGILMRMKVTDNKYIKEEEGIDLAVENSQGKG